MPRAPQARFVKKAKRNPGLSTLSAPVLIRQQDEVRIVAQTELQQLQEKRERIQDELNEIDSKILELKNRRKEELLAELEELGLDIAKGHSPTALDGKRKGRPKGFKMSDAQKQALREGRARAKAAREATASVQ